MAPDINAILADKGFMTWLAQQQKENPNMNTGCFDTSIFNNTAMVPDFLTDLNMGGFGSSPWGGFGSSPWGGFGMNENWMYMSGMDAKDIAKYKARQQAWLKEKTEVTENEIAITEDEAEIERFCAREETQLLTAEIMAALRDKDEDHIESLISGLSAHEIAAVEILCAQQTKDPTAFRKGMRKTYEKWGELRGSNERAMFDIINKAAMISPQNAALALREAMEGAGTDNKTVKNVIFGSDNEFLYEANKNYVSFFGTTIANDVKHDFNWFWGGAEKDLTAKLSSCYVRNQEQN